MKALFKLLTGNPKALFGLGILTVFIFGAIFAPLITSYAPDKRTGNPHEYPAFVVKAAQNNPDGWVAENLATSKRTLLLSKKQITYWVLLVWAVISGRNWSTERVPHSL